MTLETLFDIIGLFFLGLIVKRSTKKGTRK